MKRISAFLSFAVLFCAPAFSQGPEEAIREDRARTGGLTYLYDYKSEPAMTPAPEGYKPFYISHFGRHGARYCTWEYDSLYNWLSAAGKAGMLTPYGEAFSKRYEAFYDKVKNCEGDLTAIGVDQHRTIATRMFWRFPEVFEGKTHVDARSTDVHRVIMSMWSFLSTLQELDQDIDITADASLRYSSWLNPLDVSNPNGIKGRPRYNAKAEADRYAYFYDTVDAEGIMGRFVASPASMKEYMKTDALNFIRTLHTLATASKCLDEDRDFFDGIFTPEEDFLIWKTASARVFILLGNYEGSDNLAVDYAAFTLEQIMEKADEDIADGKTPLRLRFGHDSGLYPLLLFMDVNGYGRGSASLEESLSIAPSYIVPMGSSVQFIFYRNSAGNVLFKLLLNEREAALPFKAVEGPYYDWNDFKQYYSPAILASKKKISHEKALFEREKAAVSVENVEPVKAKASGRTAIESTVVFAEDSDFCHFYRIPAMCLDARGNVVAVCDRRYENLADLGYRKTSIDISVKRSKDGGRTWGPQSFIARGDTSKVLGYGYGDASLTLLPSGRIICLFACGNGTKGFRRGLKHTTICTSDDGGITWSEPRLIPFPDTLHSAFVTSGKGICDADGDLLLAADVLPRDYPDPMPVPWPIEVHLFYSKDGGESWTLQPEPLFGLADETKLVLLPDGRLLSSSRRPSFGPRGLNTAVKGSDGVWHWEGERFTEGLDANPCNGDIVLWRDGLLLHSYIKEAKARRGLTLAVSRDGGTSWKDILTLQPGPAAYSTMVVFRNGDVGILYEDGSRSPDNAYDIVFSRIPRRLLRQALR